MILKLKANALATTDEAQIAHIDMMTSDLKSIRLSWKSCSTNWNVTENDVTLDSIFYDLMIDNQPAEGALDILKTAKITNIAFISDIDNPADFDITVTKLEFIDNENKHIIEHDNIFRHHS